MPSLIPGYEYDIFVSYRQKDNKYDGWVTEFVENLKKELEATFKEEISVYFDINPHDGLLETHEVDDSLKEKLKCLVFIPIISRTYCDPKSFAWDHEFKAFVDQASNDQFGLKVKLPNGNVASRVLPIRIYDLDNEDIKLCESVLGGMMRGVEFIYEEPGVNRPLKSDDDEKINLKKTKYRNQINKVGNSIKEIIQGLKSGTPDISDEKAGKEIPVKQEIKDEKIIHESKSSKYPIHKLISTTAIIIILVIAAIIFYPKIFDKDRLEYLRSKGTVSVAVIPFQNMTGDESKNFWQEVVQDILITSFSNSEFLMVRQTESIRMLLENTDLASYASITPSLASNVSQKLDADVFVYGSINKSGEQIRINAKLVDSETEEVFKSFPLDGTAENIINMADSLSLMIKDYLILSLLKKETTPDWHMFLGSTRSPEALRYFLDGSKLFLKEEYTASREMFHRAIEIDSNYTSAAIMLAFAYGNAGLSKEAKKWSIKAYDNKDNIPRTDRIFAEYCHAWWVDCDPSETIISLKQLLEIDDKAAMTYYNLGIVSSVRFQYDKTIEALEKALEYYARMDVKPMWVNNYTALGEAYHETGKYRKERRLYKKAQRDFPGDPALQYRQAVLALSTGKTKSVDEYINKYTSALEERSYSEAAIASNLGSIYLEAGMIRKAEEKYREALSLQPENPLRMNNLAYILIDNEINIEEGLELANRTLSLNPENYRYLHCIGWGLYKQYKYEKALEYLEKSWELKPVYDHEVFLHLEAAKKAVSDHR